MTAPVLSTTKSFIADVPRSTSMKYMPTILSEFSVRSFLKP